MIMDDTSRQFQGLLEIEDIDSLSNFTLKLIAFVFLHSVVFSCICCRISHGHHMVFSSDMELKTIKILPLL